MFLFYRNIAFSELSFKRKCGKAISFCKCIIVCNTCTKRWNLICHIIMKTNDFWLVFSSTFCRQYLSKKMKFSTSYWSENKWLVNCSLPIYFSCNVLQEMWLKNWGSHFLLLLHCNKHFFIIINFLKICFQKQGYYIKHIYYHNNGNG